MIIDENEFFRQVTLRICGNLNIESAMRDCLIYLRAFMPGDMLHLTLGDSGLGILKTIAIATPDEAKRVNIIIPPNEVLRGQSNSVPTDGTPFIIDGDQPDMFRSAYVIKTGLWKEHSLMLMPITVKGENLGNLSLFAKGLKRFREEHLQLFTLLKEPFTIALSNSLRYDELNQLKDLMADDIQYLHNRLQGSADEMVIGKEFGLKEVMDMAREVAPMDSPVLLQGETGVGKEIIATAIHKMSKRKNGPFIQVNCGAIPDTLIDSELFGHERGAFTGAIAQKRGCFERADGGTIFLDEIAELPPQAQVRMLRVLQEKELIRVGGSRQIKVDIRIIAATHQNLEKMVNEGNFRADLRFRLTVFPITIPSLRDRKEDIPALIHHFIEKKSKDLQIPGPHRLAPGALNTLLEYNWPGNVRELENVVERSLILNKGEPMHFDKIMWADRDGKKEEESGRKGDFPPLDDVISRHIKKALRETNGRICGPGGAAEILCLNPSTLRHRIRKLGIDHRKWKQ